MALVVGPKLLGTRSVLKMSRKDPPDPFRMTSGSDDDTMELNVVTDCQDETAEHPLHPIWQFHFVASNSIVKKMRWMVPGASRRTAVSVESFRVSTFCIRAEQMRGLSSAMDESAPCPG